MDGLVPDRLLGDVSGDRRPLYRRPARPQTFARLFVDRERRDCRHRRWRRLPRLDVGQYDAGGARLWRWLVARTEPRVLQMSVVLRGGLCLSDQARRRHRAARRPFQADACHRSVFHRRRRGDLRLAAVQRLRQRVRDLFRAFQQRDDAHLGEAGARRRRRGAGVCRRGLGAEHYARVRCDLPRRRT